jgi:hypothetical protein
VSCRSGDNKRKEVLTFEVTSFDIGYNCILGMPFLLKFMAVIHIAYAMLKMPEPKGVITIKADQCDVLACENATLTHAGWFGESGSGTGGQDSEDARQEHIDQVASAQAIDDHPPPPIIVSQEGHIWCLSVEPAAHRPISGFEGGCTQQSSSRPQRFGKEVSGQYMPWS